LPEPRRLTTRLFSSGLPTRLVAHLSVVGLVAAAGFAGFTGIPEAGASEPHFTGSALFVTTVRGAAVDSQTLSTSQFDTRAASEEEFAFLDRGAPAALPGQGEPLPTPVPVDPDATPLAAPDSIGQTSTSATRPAQPRTVRVAPPAPAALAWPVPAGSISQYYHAGHLAIDIAAPYGSTIVAAQAGTVSSAGWRNNGGGYVVSINHGNGMTTIYNHLGSIWVSPGQYVGAGQGIGGVGCTGMCTGPHVHFEVIVNGVIDNPLRYL
jgi:murein DD-endopeptidase MepM/ murein hydrolase activator NlpD